MIPDAPHRPRRVGPDGIPAVEGAFIAPRFQHHDGGRAIVLFQHGELFLHVRIAVPAVGADPQPEGPLRRQHAFARQGQIGPKLGGGGSRQQMIRDSRPCGGLDANDSPLFKGKADVLSRVPEPAEAAVRQEHGHRQIAPRALPGEMLRHLSAASPALLIGAVKALAGAVHMALTAPQHRFHPGGRSVRPQKEGDFRAGKRPQRPKHVLAKMQRAFRLPERASQGQRRAALLTLGAQINAGAQLRPAPARPKGTGHGNGPKNVRLEPRGAFLPADEAVAQGSLFCGKPPPIAMRLRPRPARSFPSVGRFQHRGRAVAQAAQPNFLSLQRVQWLTGIAAVLKGYQSFRQMTYHDFSSPRGSRPGSSCAKTHSSRHSAKPGVFAVSRSVPSREAPRFF